MLATYISLNQTRSVYGNTTLPGSSFHFSQQTFSICNPGRNHKSSTTHKTIKLNIGGQRSVKVCGQLFLQCQRTDFGFTVPQWFKLTPTTLPVYITATKGKNHSIMKNSQPFSLLTNVVKEVSAV